MSNNILDKASKVVSNRQGTYDAPENNFMRIAKLWNAYIEGKPKHENITSKDVAIMMILMKIARLSFQYKEDSVIDIAGYAQCLVQVQESERKK